MQYIDRIERLDTIEESFGALEKDSWLSAAEHECLFQYGSPEHRTRRLAGRWLAKQLIKELNPEGTLQFSDIHIESRDERSRPCRPRIFVHGSLKEWSLSISHSKEFVYVAASLDQRVQLGTDVLEVSSVSESLSDFWFTEAERRWCQRSQDPFSINIVWSLKEARYKAENQGEPFYPGQVDVISGTPLEQHADLDFSTKTLTYCWDNCKINIQRTSRRLTSLVILETRSERVG